MTLKTLLKPFLFNAFVVSLCATTWAASLELGQVRSKRRGWEETVSRKQTSETREVVETDALEDYEPEITEEVFSDEPEATEIASFHVDNGVASEAKEAEPEKRVKRIRGSSKRRSGLILIGGLRKKGPTLRDGYLAVDAPPALRFSDIDPVNTRPPSPALPEFNFVSSEYMPYLIEEALSDDELNNAALLSEIVIELGTHEIVSGKIKARSNVQEELIEHFDLEEQRSTVLRPEEVLIFFETDTNMGKAGAMVPFSPASPSSTTIKSSATLRKE